ncbi:MAG: AMP-binding protein [Lachnospiraceae bacterium]|nr:AMP-binding protein [Lachnospiraceae bacterium]
MGFLDQIILFAKEDAQKTAIVDRDGERTTSFAELNALSGCIAAKLAATGLGEGSFVVLGLDRSMEYVAAYLGVLKAGCAAVPVIRSYPPERIAYIRKDCGAALLDEEFLTDIEQYEPIEPLPVPAPAPALVIYTSGSTGKPKGILHGRGALEEAVARNAGISAA